MLQQKFIDSLQVSSPENFTISTCPTRADFEFTKDEYRAILENNTTRLSRLQERLFAQNKYSILFVFQAMDAAGKDSTIERLVKGVNPQGVEVNSFKKPTEEELSHDYLWRVQKRTPPKGKIGVFNRSHYEEVLVTRVHPEFIVYQNLPGIDSVADISEDFWLSRYAAINAFERQLYDHGTFIVKFFLNVSKQEQRQRIEARMADPDKHWKFKLNDVKERANWEKYQHCFQEAIRHTSTSYAPWYAIPADDKYVMRSTVSQIAADFANSLPIDWPESHNRVLEEIAAGKRLLEAE